MEVEESDDGSLLFINIHVAASDLYFTESPVFIEITC